MFLQCRVWPPRLLRCHVARQSIPSLCARLSTFFAQGVKEGDRVVSARFRAARRQNSAVWSGTRRLQLNHQIITDIQRTEHINTNARHVFPWACATLSVSATPAIIRRCRSNSGVPGRNSRFCLQAVLRLIGSEVYGDIVYMATHRIW
jgi:hypothetical protein